jgi:hypothetical protein
MEWSHFALVDESFKLIGAIALMDVMRFLGRFLRLISEPLNGIISRKRESGICLTEGPTKISSFQSCVRHLKQISGDTAGIQDQFHLHPIVVVENQSIERSKHNGKVEMLPRTNAFELQK